jgi:hypothetical protein
MDSVHSIVERIEAHSLKQILGNLNPLREEGSE